MQVLNIKLVKDAVRKKLYRWKSVFLSILEISWALEVTFLCIPYSTVANHMISGITYFTVKSFSFTLIQGYDQQYTYTWL